MQIFHLLYLCFNNYDSENRFLEEIKVYKTFSRLFLILLASFVIINTSVSAQQQQDIVKTIEINNFTKYNDNYYRGGKPDKEKYDDLQKLGIKTIIDLRANNKKKVEKLTEEFKEFGIQYKNIPLNAFNPPKEKEIKEFFSIVDNTENQPVYVHCTFGQDRTGVMSGLYRIVNDCWTYKQAYEEMLDKGYRKILYFRLKRFLKKYYKSLVKNGKWCGLSKKATDVINNGVDNCQK